MNKFLLNEKIECVRVNCEALTEGKVYTVTGGTEYWVLVTNDRGTDSWYDPSRFKLYEEKGMFDLKKEKWFIRTPDEATYNAVYKWLQDKGFRFGWVGYAHDGWEEGVQNIGSWPYPAENTEGLRIGHTCDANYFSKLGHKEIKLSFHTETVIDKVEYPEVYSEQQKQLDIVMQQIKELSKQAKKLQQVVTEGSK